MEAICEQWGSIKTSGMLRIAGDRPPGIHPKLSAAMHPIAFWRPPDGDAS
jgi:hypothetical protein